MAGEDGGNRRSGSAPPRMTRRCSVMARCASVLNRCAAPRRPPTAARMAPRSGRDEALVSSELPNGVQPAQPGRHARRDLSGWMEILRAAQSGPLGAFLCGARWGCVAGNLPLQVVLDRAVPRNSSKPRPALGEARAVNLIGVGWGWFRLVWRRRLLNRCCSGSATPRGRAEVLHPRPPRRGRCRRRGPVGGTPGRLEHLRCPGSSSCATRSCCWCSITVSTCSPGPQRWPWPWSGRVPGW